MAESISTDELTARRLAVLRDAAESLWAWGWYDLAEACMEQVRAEVRQ